MSCVYEKIYKKNVVFANNLINRALNPRFDTTNRYLLQVMNNKPVFTTINKIFIVLKPVFITINLFFNLKTGNEIIINRYREDKTIFF